MHLFYDHVDPPGIQVFHVWRFNLREKDTSHLESARANIFSSSFWPFLATQNSAPWSQIFSFQSYSSAVCGGPAEIFDQNSVIKKYQEKGASFAIFW